MTKEFERVLRDLVTEEKTPELLAPKRMLSTTQPFPFSKKVLESKKSVFNFVACENDLEYEFAKFLNGAEDVAAFAKLPDKVGFAIEYPDSLSNIRHYHPDFVARLKDGSHWIIETKGREDIEVLRKDEAARRWCDNATLLTGIKWTYLKVAQNEYEALHPSSFGELIGGLM